MCVVSMVGDHYGDWFPKNPPSPFNPFSNPNQQPIIINPPQQLNWPSQVSKVEFDALKKEVEHMKALLIKAKLYDEKNNEPDCEVEDKMKLLREIAKVVGIDLDEVLKKKDESK